MECADRLSALSPQSPSPTTALSLDHIIACLPVEIDLGSHCRPGLVAVYTSSVMSNLVMFYTLLVKSFQE